MYKYNHSFNTKMITSGEHINLHDCKATQISLKNKTLFFTFPEGFWIERNNIPTSKKYYTGEAQMEFPLLYSEDIAIIIYIFTKDGKNTIRTEYTLNDLMKQINTNLCSLEFLYSYISSQTFRFDCWLWYDKEPYHKECELIISAENVIYHWNEVYEE